MITIEGLEISYFRSIYGLKIKSLKDICVFAGRNDCGKSNILKALNLFFNNEVDWQTPLDFRRDFSQRRLEEVRKETVKGRQFIRVKVTFRRGTRCYVSLPTRFYISKTWYRDSGLPEQKSNIDQQFRSGKIKTNSLHRAQAGLQRFLNSIRYEYVPAVKDRAFYTYSLGLLQDIILSQKSGHQGVNASVKKLNLTVEQAADELNQEFKQVCGIEAEVRLPEDLAALFRAFQVATHNGPGELPLILRGDGIQARFIPSLLHYVAEHSRGSYIWGFEEPENCLEHALATKLARDMSNTYSNNSQILVSSHSPAFIGLENKKANIYRIYPSDTGTACDPLFAGSDVESAMLSEELGLLELTRRQEQEYKSKLAQRDKIIRSLKLTREKLKQAHSPVLLTEGKTDAMILTVAWKKLNTDRSCPFRIMSCDPHEPGSEQSAAGAETLKDALETVRRDLPPTIGLFDRDEKGVKAFAALSNNFKEQSKGIKRHRNHRSIALLLPVVKGRQEYGKAQTYCIEFMFDDMYLKKKDNYGRRLSFSQLYVIIRIGGSKTKEKTTEPQYRRIKAGKRVFAENIVPTLPKKAFKPFKKLFDLVETQLEHLFEGKEQNETQG